MTETQHLSDRMPAVARGADRWSREEEAHLTHCAECAAEWRVVQAAVLLGKRVERDLAPDRVARGVAAGLQVAPRGLPFRPRRQWLVALAAAAAVLLVVWGGGGGSGTPRLEFPEQTTLLPEIEYLDTAGLDAVLDLLPTTVGWSPFEDRNGLAELGEEELERILRILEG